MGKAPRALTRRDPVGGTLPAALDANVTRDDNQDIQLIAANGKNKVYYQTAAPAGTDHVVNDLWFDSDDGYKPHRWDGAAWVAAAFGDGAIATLNVGKLVTGYLSGAAIKAGAETNNSGRVELDSAGLRLIWKNGSGVDITRVNLKTSDGTGTFTGSITGSTITGSDFQTSSGSGTRIEFGPSILDPSYGQHETRYYGKIGTGPTGQYGTINGYYSGSTNYQFRLSCPSDIGATALVNLYHLTARLEASELAGIHSNSSSMYVFTNQTTFASEATVYADKITLDGDTVLTSGKSLRFNGTSTNTTKIRQYERARVSASRTAAAAVDPSVTFVNIFVNDSGTAVPPIVQATVNAGAAIVANDVCFAWDTTSTSTKFRVRDSQGTTRTCTVDVEYLATL